jgi:hypothetical protein
MAVVPDSKSGPRKEGVSSGPAFGTELSRALGCDHFSTTNTPPGVKDGSTESQSTVSRVTFTIPIAFPLTDTAKTDKNVE